MLTGECMTQASLESWITDPQLDLTRSTHWLSSDQISVQLRLATDILSERFKAQSSSAEPLRIPTHYVRNEKSTTLHKAVMIFLMLLLIGDGLFRVWALIFFYPNTYWGQNVGSYLSILVIQIFGAWFIYRVFWRPIYRTTDYAAKRRLALSAGEAIMKDSRPPILLLRAFDSDSITVQVGFMDQQRLEEVLATDLDEIGPFIAVGRPKERGPHLGAARDYIPDNLWQHTVERWMVASQVIFAISTESVGLMWELEKLKSLGLTSKVILIAPLRGPNGRETLRRVIPSLWGAETNDSHLTDKHLAESLVTYLDAKGVFQTVRHMDIARGVDYRIAVISAMLQMFPGHDEVPAPNNQAT